MKIYTKTLISVFTSTLLFGCGDNNKGSPETETFESTQATLDDLDQVEAMQLTSISLDSLDVSESKIAVPPFLCSESIVIDADTAKANDSIEEKFSETCSAKATLLAYEKQENKILLKLEVYETRTEGASSGSSKPRTKIKSGSLKRIFDWTLEKTQKSSSELATWKSSGQITSSGTVTMESEMTLTLNATLSQSDDPLDVTSPITDEMKQKLKDVKSKIAGLSDEERNKLLLPLINDPIFNSLGAKIKLSGFIETDDEKISYARLVRIISIWTMVIFFE